MFPRGGGLGDTKLRSLRLALFLVASISIGSSAILVRLARAPGPVCAFWRLALSLPMLLLIERPVPPRRIYLLSGLALGSHFSLWMDSLFKLPVFTSTAVVTTYPAFLALLEWRESSRVSLLGVAIALLSTLSMFGLRSLNVVGLMESLAASLMATLYFWIGRIARREAKLGDYAFWAYSSASVVSLAYSLALGISPFPYLPKSFIWFLLLALVPMISGHTVMNYLIKYYKAFVVSSIAFLEPLIAGALAFVIFGELPRTSLLPSIGALVGTALVVLGESRKDKFD